MDEEIMERRIQVRGKSLAVTIPKRIAKEMKLSEGQGVRFTMEDGGIMIRPTGIGHTRPGSGPDKYGRGLDSMMDDSGSARPENGKSAGKSRLDRLEIK